MTIRHILSALKGTRIPGGCDTCNAYQECDIDQHGIGHITIRHDDWCPTLKRHQRAQQGIRRPDPGA